MMTVRWYAGQGKQFDDLHPGEYQLGVAGENV